MKFIDNILHIEFSELQDCGVSYNTLTKAAARESKSWKTANDPVDKRKVLFEYESLRDQYKECLTKRFGDVYEYVAKQPIKKLVQKDFKAEEYYLGFRFDENKPLPIEYVNKYTTAASWLNMLIKADNEPKNIKKLLNLTISQLYTHVLDLICSDKIDLPSTYVTLRRKIVDYKANGYDALISKNFGNKKAAKIGKTENGFDAEVEKGTEALIRTAASKHNKFDAVQITRAVNALLTAHSLPTLSPETIRLRMNKFEHLTTAGNSGKRTHNNRIAMQVERVAPPHPLLYWTLDGWTVELLYKNENGYNNRMVMVVVLDACGKYPVGYAIGDRENAELIKQANRNALAHIKDLFGYQYRPNQVQSDHYAIKTLTPFYSAMTNLFIPAAVGNAKAKIIEPYFNTLNKKYCQSQPNWSGFNLSSSNKNQPNREYLNIIKTSFPDRDGVIRQIESIIAKERSLKLDAYMQAFATMPQGAKVVLPHEQFLMVFGQTTDRTIQIHAAGLQPQINGIQYSFTTFEPSFATHRDIAWRIMYDEQDMSRVLAVSEDNKLRYMLEGKRKIAMDMYSATAEDHAYRNEIANYNKARREEIIQTYNEDSAKVQTLLTAPLELDDDAEASLKLMFTTKGQQKEGLQNAKRLGLSKQQNDDQFKAKMAFLKGKIDDYND